MNKVKKKKNPDIAYMEKILRTNGQLIIMGPSGSGKTMAARALAGAVIGSGSTGEDSHFPQESEMGAWYMIGLRGNEDVYFRIRIWTSVEGKDCWLLTVRFRQMVEAAIANRNKKYCFIFKIK